MAEAAKQKLFRQNQWFGGFADDEFLGLTGSFWRASGLEIRRFPRRLQLAKAMSNQAASAIDYPVRDAIVTSQFGDSIAVGDNGQVYRRAAGASTWTKVYTDTSNRKIFSIREYNGYLYWTTVNHLHRIAMTDTGTSTTWTTVTEDYKTFTNTIAASDNAPLFEAFNKLYIGNGNLLAELDSLGTLTAAKLTFAEDDSIRRITFRQGNIRVWCRKDSNTRDAGMCYFWNGTSSAYNDSVPLPGIFQTCDEKTDLFVAGHEPYICEMIGNTWVKYKKLPMLTASSADDLNFVAADIAANAMASIGGISYLGSGTAVGTIGLNPMEDGVWSWGKLNEGYGNSLNLDFPLTIDMVTCVFVAEGRINAAAVSGATEYLYAMSSSTYQTTGEVETRVFDGQEGWITKDTKFIGMAFAPLAAGEKIEIFIKTNLQAAYGSAVLTAQYSDSADVDKTFKVTRLPITGKEHNHIQYKVKLTAGTSQGSTPKLLDLCELYEDIKPV